MHLSMSIRLILANMSLSVFVPMWHMFHTAQGGPLLHHEAPSSLCVDHPGSYPHSNRYKFEASLWAMPHASLHLFVLLLGDPAWPQVHFLVFLHQYFTMLPSFSNVQVFTSWWFQPIRKILVIGSFPQVGVKIKNIWNHNLVYHENPLQFNRIPKLPFNCHQDAGMNHSACMSSGTTSRKTFKRNSSAISVRQASENARNGMISFSLNSTKIEDWRLTTISCCNL